MMALAAGEDVVVAVVAVVATDRSARSVPRRPSRQRLRQSSQRPLPRLAAQHPFHIAHRPRRAKAGFAQIHLITIFQGADQLHPIQRTQAQIRIQLRVSIYPRPTPAGNAAY